jgi:hypothetical protein
MENKNDENEEKKNWIKDCYRTCIYCLKKEKEHEIDFENKKNEQETNREYNKEEIKSDNYEKFPTKPENSEKENKILKNENEQEINREFNKEEMKSDNYEKILIKLRNLENENRILKSENEQYKKEKETFCSTHIDFNILEEKNEYKENKEESSTFSSQSSICKTEINILFGEQIYKIGIKNKYDLIKYYINLIRKIKI